MSADAVLAAVGAEQTLRALHADHDAAAAAASAAAELEGQAPAPPRPWDPPTALTPRRMLPPFPVDALPGWVGEMVAAVATATQTPPDLAGCIALAALSTAAGGRAVVEVRPGWREPVNLFTVVALPPGSRKSPVFTALTGPLLAAEQRLVEAVQPQIVEADLALRVAKARAERTAKAAEAALTPDVAAERMAEAVDAASAVEQITVPVLPRLVADDVTVEAAASLLAEQGGRLAVLSDEGGIFTTLAGRYSGVASFEVFLKGHAGTLLRVDRRGRPAEHVTAPALTLGLAVQPKVLTDIAGMPGFRDRGLLARILYALPVNTVGRRQVGAPPVPLELADTYAAQLEALVLSLAGWTDPAIVPFTPAADARMLQFEAELEPQLAPDGALGHIADWASKLAGATARLAGLLHLAGHVRDGWGRPIDPTTVDAALRLGRYYLTHALAVFDLMGADPLVDDARAVLTRLEKLAATAAAGSAELEGDAAPGPVTVTRREIFGGTLRSRFPKVTDLDPALALLEDHGWIRRLTPTPTDGPARAGRPSSPAYELHPDLCAQCAQCTEP